MSFRFSLMQRKPRPSRHLGDTSKLLWARLIGGSSRARPPRATSSGLLSLPGRARHAQWPLGMSRRSTFAVGIARSRMGQTMVPWLASLAERPVPRLSNA